MTVKHEGEVLLMILNDRLFLQDYLLLPTLPIRIITDVFYLSSTNHLVSANNVSSSCGNIGEVVVMGLRHQVADALMVVVGVNSRASSMGLGHIHRHSVLIVEGATSIPNRQILLVRGCLELVGLRAFLTLIVTNRIL